MCYKGWMCYKGYSQVVNYTVSLILAFFMATDILCCLCVSNILITCVLDENAFFFNPFSFVN